MTPEQKRQYWAKHVNGWEDSSLNLKDHCQEHTISYDQFGYWRKRLRETIKPSRKFVPAGVASAAATASLFLPGGIRLDISVQAISDILPTVYRLTQEARQ